MRFAQMHPWTFAAIGSAIAGSIVGLAIAREYSAVQALVGGLTFAAGLFLVGGVWAWASSQGDRD